MNGLAGVEGHTHSSVIAECLTSPSPVEAPSTTPGLLGSIREKKKVKNQDQDLWETRLWSGVVFLICNISSTSPCSVVKGLGCNASGVHAEGRREDKMPGSWPHSKEDCSGQNPREPAREGSARH